MVLYEDKGVCGEKSLLLAYLLRELGYGVVLFEFKPENHYGGRKLKACPVFF